MTFRFHHRFSVDAERKRPLDSRSIHARKKHPKASLFTVGRTIPFRRWYLPIVLNKSDGLVDATMSPLPPVSRISLDRQVERKNSTGQSRIHVFALDHCARASERTGVTNALDIARNEPAIIPTTLTTCMIMNLIGIPPR